MKTSEAIEFFGGISALARALNIKPPSIHDWGEYPPIARQFHIQVVTKGKLKADDIGNKAAA